MFKINCTTKKPVARLFTGAWEPFGTVRRTPDTRTFNQLTDSIDAYAQNIPEVKELAQQLKSLNPKYLGTICDTLELATNRELLNNSININAPLPQYKNRCVREILIPDMLYASKENTEAMDLVNSIINNTDSITSKYALCCMIDGILKNKDLSRQMLATSKVVEDIAKETLSGAANIDYRHQANFMDFIKACVNSTTNPDKIQLMFKNIIPAVNKMENNLEIDLLAFLKSKVDNEDILARLKTLPKYLENIKEGLKDFDLVKYLTKSENL